MKILHIWDQAGVSYVLAKYQRNLGHKVEVVKRTGYDFNDIAKFYHGKIHHLPNTGFKLICLLKSLSADIVHIHDQFEYIKFIRFFNSKKPIILHYHGTKLRTTPFIVREKYEKLVDSILVSTNNLLDYKCAKKQIYLPNPVDIEIFSKRPIRKNNKILSFVKADQDPEIIKNIIKETFPNLKLFFDIRTSKERTHPYSSMPNLLSQFEYYSDFSVRNGKIVKGNSFTSLQARALGIKTITYELKIRDHLSAEHLPENVIKKLEFIYRSIK